MGDPVAILLIVVLITAAVALWMLDSTYRARLTKTSARSAEVETKVAGLSEQVATLRSDRDSSRKRMDRLEKERDSEREQTRKLRAKIKRQGSKKDDASPGLDSGAEVERLQADLSALRAELARRVGNDKQLAAQVEKLRGELEASEGRVASLEGQIAQSSRGLRVALVDSEVEAAREDLPAFIKRIKTEITILERKVARNQEAYLSQQGKTGLLEEKLSTMRSRYRTVCRELAVLLSGDKDLDDQEAQAVAEQAAERAAEAAQWSGGEAEPAEVAVAPELAADQALVVTPEDGDQEQTVAVSAPAEAAAQPAAEATEPAEREA